MFVSPLNRPVLPGETCAGGAPIIADSARTRGRRHRNLLLDGQGEAERLQGPLLAEEIVKKEIQAGVRPQGKLDPQGELGAETQSQLPLVEGGVGKAPAVQMVSEDGEKGDAKSVVGDGPGGPGFLEVENGPLAVSRPPLADFQRQVAECEADRGERPDLGTMGSSVHPQEIPDDDLQEVEDGASREKELRLLHRAPFPRREAQPPEVLPSFGNVAPQRRAPQLGEEKPVLAGIQRRIAPGIGLGTE